MIQADGVRFLEHRLESYFMHWAWQWNVGATPEFGSYLGMGVPFDHIPLCTDI
jgi:hypothetical protein